LVAECVGPAVVELDDHVSYQFALVLEITWRSEKDADDSSGTGHT